jgi:beta-lactamase superfamily II metal-dependent hydrolase
MFDGLEVDVLSVGDADCLLVSVWNGYLSQRILVDGGNGGDAPAIRSFLKQRSISYLDAIVSTHFHNDHAAGLVKIVEDRSISIGSAYVQIPQNHLQMSRVERAIKMAGVSGAAQLVEKTLQMSRDLLSALRARGLTPIEPFTGVHAGPLTIVGPSQAYYQDLVQQFEDVDALRAIDQGNLTDAIESAIDDAMVKTGILSEGTLLDNPQTSPENNASVMMGTVFKSNKFLFTSDAGVPALKLGIAAYDLSGCYWIQVPHHGSRRNITSELIEHFSPRIACVSASGSKKHPRRAVVSAFKKAGAVVYSTHYPNPGHLWHWVGTVPSRSEYGPATALYKAESKSEAA